MREQKYGLNSNWSFLWNKTAAENQQCWGRYDSNICLVLTHDDFHLCICFTCLHRVFLQFYCNGTHAFRLIYDGYCLCVLLSVFFCSSYYAVWTYVKYFNSKSKYIQKRLNFFFEWNDKYEYFFSISTKGHKIRKSFFWYCDCLASSHPLSLYLYHFLVALFFLLLTLHMVCDLCVMCVLVYVWMTSNSGESNGKEKYVYFESVSCD